MKVRARAMVTRTMVLVITASMLWSAASPLWAQQSYPTVYGDTGRPYGPTQAAYQYERRYGQPWHGYGGQTTTGSFRGTHTVSGWPAWGGTGGMWSNGYCPNGAPWGYSPFAPVVIVAPVVGTGAGPYIYGPNTPGPITTSNGAMGNMIRRGGASAPIQPDFADGLGPVDAGVNKIDPSQVPVAESSAAAKLRSLERQSIGDEKVRKQLWAQAYIDYRAAVDTAPDRAEAHYRLGYVFVALRQYASAVREFKRGVFLDPTLPQTGARLVTVFGPNSQIVRNSILHKVGDHLREDIRDSDRLFLFAVMLHFEDDPRARDVFEAAQRMSLLNIRSADHIAAYLNLPVEKPAASQPQPVQNEIALPPLPTLQPNPNTIGTAPAGNDDLPPAPIPTEPSSTLPPLSTEAIPPKGATES
jgi:tetratricopeptide (TPR) repeat protein